MSDSTLPPSSIAIIGLACRFPGAASAAEFWRNLRDGVESVTFFTDEELLALGVPAERLKDPQFVRATPVLADSDQFDAGFFGYSPREAKLLDPQHRLFLQTSWEALEVAGYDPERYEGFIGVYAGMSLSTYLLFNVAPNPDYAHDDLQVMLGNDKDFLSTRVSYHFNLRGPSLDVQTGCSTSLVATHLACDSLLSYQCDIALAGGVSLAMPQRSGYLYQEGGIASPDGHCRAYAAEGQGTIFGSGVGVVVLKRLEEAVADGDTIYAVIRGSAINNDGSAKLGYTAPSVVGQAEVITRAQGVAGVTADEISYVEGHGTATALGDPIEVEALTQAFRATSEQKTFCALGSVKTNIGHLDAAAGVAGLIKTVLSLKNEQIPPSLHFTTPNPKIDFANSPFYVNGRLTPWPSTGNRLAGVSSFGIGGTNAHVILQEAPPPAESTPSRPWQLLLLSARTEEALEMATVRLVDYLRDHSETNLADVAYTLQIGRKRFAQRRLVVCQSREEAIDLLSTAVPDRVLTAVQPAKERPVVFLFSGQGSQYVNMGRGLYEQEAVFRQQLDQVCDLLRPLLGFDLRAVLYPPVGEEETATAQLRQTAVTQPALFAIEYALAQQWRAWGIQPQAMMGHSIGEYVAACLAGVFSLADALKLVVVRGRLMQTVPAGAMLAVPLAEKEVQPYLNADIAIAALNSTRDCVLSGPSEAIEALRQQLEAADVQCRPLHTSHAFHSAMMTPILADFRAEVARVSLNAPQQAFISNVSGTWITAAEAANPDYWVAHLRQTVRFVDGLGELLADPTAVLLEVGPGNALTTLARQAIGRGGTQEAWASLRHPREPQADLAHWLTTVGRLWQAGVALDWPAFYGDEQRQRIALPTYPFEQQRHWVEPMAATAPRPTPNRKKPLDEWFYVPSWKRTAPLTAVTLPPATWLIFADEVGLAERVTATLREAGHTVLTVHSGREFAHHDQKITVRLTHEADYAALTAVLQENALLPQYILHFWNISGDKHFSSAQSQARSFGSLLFLAQALERQGLSHAMQWGIVSDGAQAVLGDELAHPAKAQLIGPCRVIPQEYPHITCRAIDVDQWTHPRFVAQLLAELGTPLSDQVVAYRRGQRWLEQFEPVPLPPLNGRPALLRPHGVYLITGGLGGLGLTVADYLARTVQAKLVLNGRSALPPRETWADWLAEHDATDATSQKIHAVLNLEAQGAEVLVLAGDVTNIEQMDDVIAQAKARFGPIHGLFHAAGLPGGGMIPLKTAVNAAEILAPKVQGTLVLANLLQDDNLDFYFLFASLTGLLGGLGQVDYCAANAFLDAFATQKSAAGFRWLSVDWNEWQEVGMAANTALPFEFQQWRQKELPFGLTPAEGQEVLGRILAADLTQVVVATRDLAGLQAQMASLTIATLLAELEKVKPAGVKRSSGRQATYVAPHNDIEEKIVAIWQEVLEIDQVGIHDNFFELGGNSLMGLKLIARVNKELGVQVTAVSLYEGPTVHKLTELIAQMSGSEESDEEAYGANQRRGDRRRERLKQKRQK